MSDLTINSAYDLYPGVDGADGSHDEAPYAENAEKNGWKMGRRWERDAVCFQFHFFQSFYFQILGIDMMFNASNWHRGEWEEDSVFFVVFFYQFSKLPKSIFS